MRDRINQFERLSQSAPSHELERVLSENHEDDQPTADWQRVQLHLTAGGDVQNERGAGQGAGQDDEGYQEEDDGGNDKSIKKKKILSKAANNQDETSLCVGSEHEKVLAPVGYHRPVYNLGGDSRAHTSISTIISGDGKYVGCRIVYKGVRNTTEKIANIPKDGITGEWRCSVSPEGYVNREVFQQGILADLVEHCETENIPKPVCIQCPV